MKTSGIIFPDENQDNNTTQNTLTSESPASLVSSKQNPQAHQSSIEEVDNSYAEKDKVENYLNIPSGDLEIGSMDAEIENKQFNYDLPQKNTKNYIPLQDLTSTRTPYQRRNSVNAKSNEESNLSKSFKIDHRKAEIKRKEYSRELTKLKRSSLKSKKLKTSNKIRNKTSKSSKKYKGKTKVDRKKELKTQVAKAKKHDNSKKESIFRDLLSLNIVENIVLRYVVAIIAGIIVFGTIFTGLGLVSNQ